MNQRTIHATAKAYDTAPDGASLYADFIRETLAQAESLSGLTVEPVSNTEPYSNSRELFRDIERNRIRVNSIDPLAPGHPLARLCRVRSWGLTLSANVVFRVVHDVLGHHDAGEPFESFLGEYRAYQRHARQYVSPASLAVLHSETLGQLAAFYSGAGFQPIQFPRVIL